jgi:hypothetical protein
MKSFRFPLQRVLDWRSLQLRREEEKFSLLQSQLVEWTRRETALLEAQSKAEMDLLSLPFIYAADLRALAAYRLRVRSERAVLQANRAECEKQIVKQREQLLKSKKACLVLEKLKERRLKTWNYLGDRELEDTAAESYISGWLRSKAELNDGGAA